MDRHDLDQMLSRMAGVGVVTIGDVMVDRFVYGEVSRVSPEAPIPVMARRRESVMLGGCGNVARNVAALGGQARLVGVLGEDEVGREAKGLIAAEPAIRDGLVGDCRRPTTLKTRFVAAGQQLLRVDVETTTAIDAATERQVIDTLVSVGGDARAILVSDYGKGVVTDAVIKACLDLGRESGAVLVVDSKARGFARYGAVDVVKPNAHELAIATDLPTETDAQVEAALAKALAGSEAGAILVTRAARGMSLAVRGGAVAHFSLPPPEVFDTVGAGDTALAALGLALAAGASSSEAVQLALLASSVAVQKAGAATVSPTEILEAHDARFRVPLDAKIVSLARMAALTQRWRDMGLRVGFTNGCFDILHPGHIACLVEARSYCDRLVVGLNTDASVTAAKGPDRPVNALEARARVLAALGCVDLVVPFAEATPIDLITAARPQVLVKGGDYALDQVVGADLVRGWGGEVRLAGFLEGHSTTATLARMAGRD